VAKMRATAAGVGVLEREGVTVAFAVAGVAITRIYASRPRNTGAKQLPRVRANRRSQQRPTKVPQVDVLTRAQTDVPHNSSMVRPRTSGLGLRPEDDDYS
jgi:hypothetical protein